MPEQGAGTQSRRAPGGCPGWRLEERGAGQRVGTHLGCCAVSALVPLGQPDCGHCGVDILICGAGLPLTL